MTLLRPESLGPEPVRPGTNWMAIGSVVLGLVMCSLALAVSPGRRRDSARRLRTVNRT
jgi:hypothetical protein